MEKIEELIRKLELEPHPEGGYFKETYRSEIEMEESSLPAGYSGSRNVATCIYFLLTSDTFSAFHRIKQDEMWHFYSGSPIRLHVLSENGEHTEQLIGNDIFREQIPQFLVPGGNWFGARVEGENTYALVGCTVSPGFDFRDFELTGRRSLLKRFPDQSAIINELTRV